MSHEKILQLFKDAEAFLINARDALNKNELVDLTDMEPVVAELCYYIEKLPQEEAQTYQIHLEAFGQALTAITKVLLERKTEIRNQLQSLQKQSAAQSAYINHSDAKD